MKKRKLNEIDESSTNPLQRGKYGLRMLPQQVDYYQVNSFRIDSNYVTNELLFQSVLEDRKIKQHRQSSRQNSKDGEKDEKQADQTQNPVSNKKNVEHKHDVSFACRRTHWFIVYILFILLDSVSYWRSCLGHIT